MKKPIVKPTKISNTKQKQNKLAKDSNTNKFAKKS